MKVYGFTKDNQGVMEIENTVEAEQKFVGGLSVQPLQKI